MCRVYVIKFYNSPQYYQLYGINFCPLWCWGGGGGEEGEQTAQASGELQGGGANFVDFKFEREREKLYNRIYLQT